MLENRLCRYAENTEKRMRNCLEYVMIGDKIFKKAVHSDVPFQGELYGR